MEFGYQKIIGFHHVFDRELKHWVVICVRETDELTRGLCDIESFFGDDSEEAKKEALILNDTHEVSETEILKSREYLISVMTDAFWSFQDGAH